jgi:predicted RNA-binding protein with TRAM domain
MSENEAPVKFGEKHDVWINSVGEKGDGIAKIKGFVLFVPGVKKGDYVKVEITKVLAKVGFAKVVEQLEKPERRPSSGSPRKRKFETISKDELYNKEPEYSEDFEETDDFGGDLDDED